MRLAFNLNKLSDIFDEELHEANVNQQSDVLSARNRI